MIRTRSLRFALIAAPLVAAASMCALPTANAQTFGGNELLDWSVPGAPDAGLTTITYPMTVHPDTAHVAGIYFAQQYNFIGQDNVGYTGLQPRPDANGKPQLHGAFSSFIPGTTTNDPNCSDGADGGAGVSCAVDFDGVYGDTYNVTVSHDTDTTWSGTLVDTVTGKKTHIGTYKLPAGTGNLKSSQVGFIEYYDVPGCDKLPRYDVTFGGPTSGNLAGTTTYNSEYGNCQGQGGTQHATDGSGVRVSRGTPAPTGPTTPGLPMFGSS